LEDGLLLGLANGFLLSLANGFLLGLANGFLLGLEDGFLPCLEDSFLNNTQMKLHQLLYLFLNAFILTDKNLPFSVLHISVAYITTLVPLAQTTHRIILSVNIT
jgi:hypothetical protein